jgi:phage terminase small subunit
MNTIKKRGKKFAPKKTKVNGKEVKKHKASVVEALDIKLTPKENQFLWHYFTNGYNATRAVLASFHNINNEDTARAYASKLTAKVSIKRAIDDHLNMVYMNKQITPERIIGEVAAIAFSKIDDYIDVQKAAVFDGEDINDPETLTYKKVVIRSLDDMNNTRAVAAIKQGAHGIEIKLWDKPKALEMLIDLVKLKMVSNGSADDLDLSKLTQAELETLINLQIKARKDEQKQLE